MSSSDISKCTGINEHYLPENPKHTCPIREKCVRFLVKANPYRQSYIKAYYSWVDEHCPFYRPNEDK